MLNRFTYKLRGLEPLPDSSGDFLLGDRERDRLFGDGEQDLE